jgi:hypothetical protein
LAGLCERANRELQAKAAAYEQARQAAAHLGDDTRMAQSVLKGDPLWGEVAADLLVTEKDLLEASDDLVDSLIVTAPPDALVCFLCGAGAELRLRLQGKLPAYLRAMYNADASRVIPDDEAQRARATVFRVFRRLKRREPARSLEVVK